MVFSLYVTLWCLVISFFAVDLSLALSALGCLVGAAFLPGLATLAGAGMLLGAALACVGLSILLFFVCAALAKGLVRLTGRRILGIKIRIMRKERENART